MLFERIKQQRFYRTAKSGLNMLKYEFIGAKPIFCVYFVTLNCNLRCKFCPIVEQKHSPSGNKIWSYVSASKSEFTTVEAKLAIDKLAMLGISVLALTGGEPLMRKDLEEIASHAKRKHMLISLNTNATLVTKERAKKLCGTVDRVTVSLDGLRTTHDKIRGKGSFERTVKGIRQLREFTKSSIGLYFVINNLNYNEIEDVLKFAKANADFIIYQLVQHDPKYFINAETCELIKKRLYALKKSNPRFILNDLEYINLLPNFMISQSPQFRCEVFRLFVSLSQRGDFSGCSYPFTIGNILKEDIKSLWKRGLKEREKLLSECGGCSYVCFVQPSISVQKPIHKLLSNEISKLGFFSRRHSIAEKRVRWKF